MNIKQSELVAIIKEVVRECIEERKDKWIQKAVNPSHKGYCTPMTKSTCTPRRKALAQRFKKGDIHADNVSEENMNEVAPPGFGPDKEHAKIYNKLMKQYKDNPEAAYATMWKIHDKLDEVKKLLSGEKEEDAEVTNEASYKVVSPNETDTAAEDKARAIQTEPKVNETAYKTQGPSAKTFKDSPQFPDAVNDPENA